MATLLLKEGGGLYPEFRERLLQVAAEARGIGWGYGDYMQEVVSTLEDKLGNDARP